MKRREFLGSLLALGAAEAVTGVFAPPGWIIREARPGIGDEARRFLTRALRLSAGPPAPAG